MKSKIILFILFLFCFTIRSVYAQSTKYDSLYSRPTYYPGFTLVHSWPNNMSYFVRAVNSQGHRMINYEVAVLDKDDNIRAIGRSIHEDDEVCTLTIPGNENEEFHFVVLYGDNYQNPESAKVIEKVNFVTNDIVGDLTDPFILTLDGVTAIDGVSADGNQASNCYLLNGTYMKNQPAHGLFIQNGKKILK